MLLFDTSFSGLYMHLDEPVVLQPVSFLLFHLDGEILRYSFGNCTLQVVILTPSSILCTTYYELYFSLSLIFIVNFFGWSVWCLTHNTLSTNKRAHISNKLRVLCEEMMIDWIEHIFPCNWLWMKILNIVGCKNQQCCFVFSIVLCVLHWAGTL